MRTLLISTPIGMDNTMSKVHTLPSLGVYRLQYFLHKNGFECDILNTDLEDIDNFIQHQGKTYDIIGVSSAYFPVDACLQAVEKIKRAQGGHGLLVAGGVAATYAPQAWLDMGLDVVVLGYGEYPLLHICRAMQDDPTLVLSKLSTIDGVALYQNGTFMLRPAAPLTPALFKELTLDNMLEFSIPYEKFWEYNAEFIESLGKKNFYFALHTANVYTSSQCPNRCGYCNGKFLDEAQQAKARLCALNAEELFTLVRAVVRQHNPKLIYFSDDDFLFSKPRTIAFAEAVIKAKKQGILPAELDFGCQSRVVNLLKNNEPDVEYIRLLGEAGFKPITVGAESCTPRLLQTPLMHKGGYGKEQVFSLARALLDQNINAGVNFMLMLPDSTREEVLHDLHCAYELLVMGVEIRVTVKVFSQYGAPALKLPQYPTQKAQHISPLNGSHFEFPNHFKHKDPTLSQVIDTCAAILPEVERSLKEKYHLQERMRNSFYAISRCIALGRALGDEALTENFHHAAELWFADA